MYYFIGTPLADGSCPSFCLWRSRPDAVVAAADPEHREAMVKGLPCFEHYLRERYEVAKRDGARSFLSLALHPPSTSPHPGLTAVHATSMRAN